MAVFLVAIGAEVAGELERKTEKITLLSFLFIFVFFQFLREKCTKKRENRWNRAFDTQMNNNINYLTNFDCIAIIIVFYIIIQASATLSFATFPVKSKTDKKLRNH